MIVDIYNKNIVLSVVIYDNKIYNMLTLLTTFSSNLLSFTTTSHVNSIESRTWLRVRKEEKSLTYVVPQRKKAPGFASKSLVIVAGEGFEPSSRQRSG